MMRDPIRADIEKELNSALTTLVEKALQDSKNIDEICAVINTARLSGALWTVVHCYPSEDEDDRLLILAVIEGEEFLLTMVAGRRPPGCNGSIEL